MFYFIIFFVIHRQVTWNTLKRKIFALLLFHIMVIIFFLLINEEEKTNKFRLNRVLSSIGQFSAENYVLISIYYFFIYFFISDCWLFGEKKIFPILIMKNQTDRWWNIYPHSADQLSKRCLYGAEVWEIQKENRSIANHIANCSLFLAGLPNLAKYGAITANRIRTI